MLDIVKGMYRVLVEILFWVILIVCIIIGYKAGGNGDYALYGALIGTIVGLSVDILIGGFVATIIAIEEHTAITEENAIMTAQNTAKILSFLKKNINAGQHDTDEQGRINYRTWYDPDSGKHES